MENAGPSATHADEAAQKHSWNWCPPAWGNRKRATSAAQTLFETFYVNNQNFCWTFCPLEILFEADPIWARLSAFVKVVVLAVSGRDPLPTYFLSLLSEQDVLVLPDGDEETSSVSQVLCLLFPYKTLGAELLNCAEVGVVVAARTGRAFSAVGVLYPWGV